MSLICKFLTIIAKALAGLFAVVITLYVFLLMINVTDEEPSPAAITMQNLQQAIKPAEPLSAGNNGYFFLQQISSAESFQLSTSLTTLLRNCPGAECHAALSAEANLADLVAQHQTVLDWYQQLATYTIWYEPVPADAAEALPSYSSLMAAQRLQLTKAWLAAQQQDTATAQQLLQQDLFFWRSLLLKNNLLISKMITTSAIKQHFGFAAVIQQQLAPEQQHALLPDSWLQPFSEDELNMQQVFSGEWAYGNNLDTVLVNPEAAGTDNMAEYLATVALAPLFQKQATRNQRAAQLLAVTQSEPLPEPSWYSWFYNPIGKLLNSMGPDSIGEYQQKVMALELLRQQAVATATALTG